MEEFLTKRVIDDLREGKMVQYENSDEDYELTLVKSITKLSPN